MEYFSMKEKIYNMLVLTNCPINTYIILIFRYKFRFSSSLQVNNSAAFGSSAGGCFNMLNILPLSPLEVNGCSQTRGEQLLIFGFR